MNKYRKIPVIITAIQWDGDIDKMINDLSVFASVRYPYLLNGELMVPTLEGTLKADLGDYIIRGVENEIYPCKPDIFRKTYIKVLDEAVQDYLDGLPLPTNDLSNVDLLNNDPRN